MKLKKMIIGGLALSLSFAAYPVNTDAAEKKNDSKVIYKAPENNDISDTYDLAVKQEKSNDETIEIAGEEFPVMDEGSKASIEKSGKDEVVDTKTATEVLSVEKDNEGEVSAEMVTTTIAEVDQEEVSENAGHQPQLQAAFTNVSGKEQFDSKKNVYVIIKVYYHFQKMSNKDDHIDMNYIMVGAEEKNKATSITSARLTMIQRGFTQYGFFTDKYEAREMGLYDLLKVDVPDSWVPVSRVAGIVGGEHKVTYQKYGKKYSVTVKNYPQNNLQ